MAGKSAARSDKSEKKNNDDNESFKHVPLAEFKVLKEEYKTLKEEHEILKSKLLETEAVAAKIEKDMTRKEKYKTLIYKTLKSELLETEHMSTLKDLAKKQIEAVAAKEHVEYWEKRLGELKQQLEDVSKCMEELGELKKQLEDLIIECMEDLKLLDEYVR